MTVLKAVVLFACETLLFVAVNHRRVRDCIQLCVESVDYMIAGLLLILAGLLVAVFSGPIARFQIAMNKRLLGVELPFEWSRAACVIVGALLSFSGVLKVLQLPPV